MRRDPDDVLPLVEPGTAVPKVIHQVYLGRELPAGLAATVQRVKDTNPGWEHRFYDDARMVDHVRTRYGAEVLGYLERIDPRYAAARADLFRYLLVYGEGGVYLDAKSLTERPLDEVLRPDDTYLVSQWDNLGEGFDGFGLHEEVAGVPGGEYQQWWLAGAAGHPLLRAALLQVMRNVDTYRVRGAGTGQQAVLRTTGPIAYTLALSAVVDQHPCRRVRDERELGLRYSTLPGLAHMRMDPTHYSRQWRPVVRVGGVPGLVNDLVAVAVKAYWVADWRLRWLLRGAGRSRVRV